MLQTLLPVVAAVLCFQTAAAFLVLFLRFGRRRSDLVFSGLALALGGMAWASFLTNRDPHGEVALFWLRMQYVGAFLALALFLHLSGLLSGPAPRRVTTALVYVLGLGLVLATFSDSFVRLRPAGEPFFETGRLYQLLMPLLLAEAAIAWVLLLRGARRAQDPEFAPLEAHLPTILAGTGSVLASGVLVVILVIFFPHLELGFSPHSLAAAVFCATTAVALLKELVRSETEKARLQQLVVFRDRAVRDVAHELRNPLAGIQGAADMLLAVPVRPETQRELLTLCVVTCQRLMRLLNNMLDTARLEAGRDVDLRVDAVDLRTLARSVLEAQRLTTTQHELRVECDLDDPVAQVDGDKLYQILTNLVGNAIKYSPDGGPVVLRIERSDGGWRLSVSDQGIGLTADEVTRLFEPYSRVVDPERKITGTGVGLHLVKRLAEVHGGRISVVSEPGTGTTFTVELPDDGR